MFSCQSLQRSILLHEKGLYVIKTMIQNWEGFLHMTWAQIMKCLIHISKILTEVIGCHSKMRACTERNFIYGRTSRLWEHINNQHTAFLTGCSNISEGAFYRLGSSKGTAETGFCKIHQEAPFCKIVLRTSERFFLCLCVWHFFEQACAREVVPSAWEPPWSPWLCSVPSLTFCCFSLEEKWLKTTNTLQMRFGTSEGYWDLVYWWVYKFKYFPLSPLTHAMTLHCWISSAPEMQVPTPQFLLW